MAKNRQFLATVTKRSKIARSAIFTAKTMILDGEQGGQSLPQYSYGKCRPTQLSAKIRGFGKLARGLLINP